VRLRRPMSERQGSVKGGAPTCFPGSMDVGTARGQTPRPLHSTRGKKTYLLRSMEKESQFRVSHTPRAIWKGGDQGVYHSEAGPCADLFKCQHDGFFNFCVGEGEDTTVHQISW